MARVDVAQSVLQWAQQQSGKTIHEVVEKFPHWNDWLGGTLKPTVRQMQDFAQFCGVPFGYLFLQAPPATDLPIPDFRAGYQGGVSSPSRGLLDVVYLCQSRQSWYKDYVDRLGLDRLDFVGSARADTPPETAAGAIRRALNFEVEQRAALRTRSDVRRHLLDEFEELGGLTVTTSMVGNNTKRRLDAEEFRGFALSDEYAPLICVNASDTMNGQIFTIVHEIAHIWRGSSGVSDGPTIHDTGSELEIWCNAVAAETLVPVRDLREQVRTPLHEKVLVERLEDLAQRYRCSTLVVLLQLRKTKQLYVIDFDATYARERDRLKRLADATAATSGGGNFYANQKYRIGSRLSRALIADTAEGSTSIAEAMRLTSFKSLSTFDKFAKQMVGA